MNSGKIDSPPWQVAIIESQTLGNYGIGSLVLASLTLDQGGFVYLLIRFWTRYPEPSGVEGDHLYFSLSEAYEEATLQFGIQDSDWKVLPAKDKSWIDKGILVSLSCE